MICLLEFYVSGQVTQVKKVVYRQVKIDHYHFILVHLVVAILFFLWVAFPHFGPFCFFQVSLISLLQIDWCIYNICIKKCSKTQK